MAVLVYLSLDTYLFRFIFPEHKTEKLYNRWWIPPVIDKKIGDDAYLPK